MKFKFSCLTDIFSLGPWHVLKILTARIWLAWKMVRQPRVLNVYNTQSKDVSKIGVIATDLEKQWDLPHPLPNREVTFLLVLFGLKL